MSDTFLIENNQFETNGKNVFFFSWEILKQKSSTQREVAHVFCGIFALIIGERNLTNV